MAVTTAPLTGNARVAYSFGDDKQAYTVTRLNPDAEAERRCYVGGR